MKLIIDISEDVYTRLFDNDIQDNEIAVDDVCEIARALRVGTPLNDVKAEIDQSPDLNPDYPMDKTIHISKWNVMQILDNIGKGDKE